MHEMKSKAFVFNQKETDQGHELEVLIASGVHARLIKTSEIRRDFTVGNVDQPSKVIPVFVLQIDLS